MRREARTRALPATVAGVVRWAVALLLAAAAPVAFAESNASGSFEGRSQKLDIGGAYSYWGEALRGSGRVIKVAISNAEFRPDLLDQWVDRGAVVHDLFANEQVKVVYFDFDPDGTYRGYSYDFAGGDGCGYCYDSSVRSTVRAAGGRLKGKVAFKGAAGEVAFDVNFDVAVPDKVWGAPLPADGGEPGRAYLAYHKALATGDIPALKAASDARGKDIIAKYDKQGEAREYANFRWEDLHFRMKTVTIIGGFVKGDRAVVQFDGSSPVIDALHGEAVLRREGGTWLVDDELVQVGKRDK